LKAQHPGALLLYQLGDFYEAFDDDAAILARDARVTLTSRSFGRSGRVPLAGIPQHALTHYLGRLLAAGHTVAVAEQVEPAGKGLVRREVTRVLSPGVVADGALLPPAETRWLAAVAVRGERLGLSWLDASIGDWAVAEWSGAGAATALTEELARLAPAETLVPDDLDDAPWRSAIPGHVRRVERWPADPERAADALQAQLGAASLIPFGCAEMPAAVGAAGLILARLEETDPRLLPLLSSIRTAAEEGRVGMDAATRRNLEIVRSLGTGGSRGSLLGAIEPPATAMGARALRRLLGEPLRDLPRLRARQDLVAALAAAPTTRRALAARLLAAGDLERVAARVATGRAAPRDLLGLRDGLREVGPIRDLVASLPGGSGTGMRVEAGAAACAGAAAEAATGTGADIRVEAAPGTEADAAAAEAAATGAEAEARIGAGARAGAAAPAGTGTGLWAGTGDGTGAGVAARAGAGAAPGLGCAEALPDPCDGVLDGLERAVEADVDGAPRIRPGFAPELDRALAAASGTRSWLAGLEGREKERTGIRSLKVGYTKVFGYFLEVTRPNLGLVPEDWRRKQTVAGGERFVTAELKDAEARLLAADEEIAGLEGAAVARVCEAVAMEVGRLQRAAAALAVLDALLALAETAVRRGWTRPELSAGEDLDIRGGRHPVVEDALAGDPFIPNDCRLGGEHPRQVVVTGPNMGGKSTWLRQVGLIVLLAQVGSFVPAAAARVGLVDRICTRVGAHDDLARGRSTFMVEMTETASILHGATGRSLLLLDEIGRGTGTADGLAIAQAVLEDIAGRIGARCLFATHYLELTAVAEALPGAANAHVGALEAAGRVVFLYAVRPGPADRAYGVQVARLAGLPPWVADRAETLLEGIRSAPALGPMPMPSPVADPNADPAMPDGELAGSGGDGTAQPPATAPAANPRPIVDRRFAVDAPMPRPRPVEAPVAVRRAAEPGAPHDYDASAGEAPPEPEHGPAPIAPDIVAAGCLAADLRALDLDGITAREALAWLWEAQRRLLADEAAPTAFDHRLPPAPE
jgi:DNA mismatch repair protein MutS